ncbi:MFS transporter [Lichenicoccus roseus]|uniref:MFS transporter n=1 Tax=Lichenicoccus roseus TaxID=2683649 RepID=A0A5R9JAA4_9PROT|nr:MFS transporter [Lichenicoccus roseus]TLU72296.1 MFS transporter [Lichenicoccus roseus]
MGALLRQLAAQKQPAPDDAPPVTAGMLLGTAGLVLFAFLYYIDERMASAAAADLRGGFRQGSDDGSWLSTAYTLGQVLMIPMTPWLAMVFSPRRMAAVLIVVTVLSAAALTAHQSYATVIALRLLQGFGEGGSVPLMLGAILQVIPPYRKPEALTVYGLVVTIPVAASFSLSGVAVDFAGWRWLLSSAPLLGPVALFLVLTFLPKKPIEWSAFYKADYFGLFCLTAAAASLVVACDQGQRLDWFDSGFIDALFVLFAWFAVCFVLNTLWRPDALYALSTFRKPNFTIGLLEIGVFSASLLGASMLFPMEQEQLRYLRPLQVGNTLLWLGIPLACVASMLPFLLRHVDARPVLALGLTLGCIGSWLCVWLSPAWAGHDYLPFLLLQATGWLMVMVTNAFLTTGVLEPKDMLTGSAMFNLTRTLGFSAGGAIVTAIVTVRERVHSNANVVRSLDPGRPPVQHYIAQVQADPLATRLATLGQAQARVLSYADAWGWLAIALLVALALTLILAPAKVMIPPGRPTKP